MGNVAVRYVPWLLDYESAKKQYEKTTPIRGSDKRPLGRRRDHNMYSIRMGAGDSVELVCYKTPVVTFYPDGRMRLMMGGWSSITTRSFMSQVLHISSSSSGRFTKVHIGGRDYILQPKGEYFFERSAEAEGKWVALNPETHTSYRINRKGANNVRKRYKKFADYLNAFVNLRSEPGKESFQVGLAEYAQAFGVHDANGVSVISLWANSNHGQVVSGDGLQFVPMPGMYEILDHQNPEYEIRSAEFAELISGDDLFGSHEKFYKAALWLTCGNWPQKLVNDNIRHRSVWGKGMKEIFKKFVLQYHTDETLEAYTTEFGQMPNLKYASMVKRDK